MLKWICTWIHITAVIATWTLLLVVLKPQHRVISDKFLRFVEVVALHPETQNVAKSKSISRSESSSEEGLVVLLPKIHKVIPLKVVWSDSSSEEKPW
jgi:hypothetical protein